MLVRLTYYGTDKVTLVNFENVESVYQVFDIMNKRFSTKICFSGDSFVNVEEDLQTVMKLSQEVKQGIYQDWDFDTPPVEDRMENSYYERKNRNPRNNTRDSRNYNSW
jgi:hypothetical protein